MQTRPCGLATDSGPRRVRRIIPATSLSLSLSRDLNTSRGRDWVFQMECKPARACTPSAQEAPRPTSSEPPCCRKSRMRDTSALSRARAVFHLPRRPGFFMRVAQGAAAGIAYLHKQKIIHRDLKSANVGRAFLSTT
eukprot:5803209-Pleurochrysis_carterae.AAC.1